MKLSDAMRKTFPGKKNTSLPQILSYPPDIRRVRRDPGPAETAREELPAPVPRQTMWMPVPPDEEMGQFTRAPDVLEFLASKNIEQQRDPQRGFLGEAL